MVKKIPPTDWQIFVNFDDAQKFASVLDAHSYIKYFEFEDVVNKTLGIRFELYSTSGSTVPVTENDVDKFIKAFEDKAAE